MSGHDHQNWEPVVLRKSGGGGGGGGGGSGGGAAASAPRAGGGSAGSKMAAIEADSETFKVAPVSTELRMALQQARTAKKLTQKELAMAVRVR